MARIPSWIANEEFENAEIVSPEVGEVPSETVEAQLVEVDGLDRQIEALIDDGQELADDTDNVEEIQETLEESEEEGGVDETAAEIAEIATEAFCAKWGISRCRIAKEGFSDESTRRQATRVAIESLSESAKSMWARFVQLIQSIIDRAKDMMYNFSNAGSRLQKRAGKLKAQFDKKFAAPRTLGTESLEGKWVRYFLFDDKVDVKKTLAFAGDGAMGPKVATAAANPLVVVTGEWAEMEKSEEPSFMDKLIGKLSSAYHSFMDMFSPARPNLPAGAANGKGCALPGNIIVSYYDLEKVAHIDMGTREIPKDLKIAALSKAELPNALLVLKKLGMSMEASIKDFRKNDELLASLKKTIVAAKEREAKSENARKRIAAHALKCARQAVMNTENEKRAVNVARVNAAQGIGALIENSIKAYS